MATKKNGNNAHSLFGLTLTKIQPLTETQQQTFEAYGNTENLVLSGAAGTGKTFIGLYLALNDLIKHKEIYHKIIILKSIVPTRQIGFLPGTAQEKIKEYEGVYSTIINDLFQRDDAYSILTSKNIISFESSSFLRGRTFSNCIVIVDEIQNMTFHELDTIITRTGSSCKLLFIGDEEQMDVERRSSGMMDFLKILKKLPEHISVIRFGISDIVRSGLVKDYLLAKYQDET